MNRSQLSTFTVRQDVAGVSLIQTGIDDQFRRAHEGYTCTARERDGMRLCTQCALNVEDETVESNITFSESARTLKDMGIYARFPVRLWPRFTFKRAFHNQVVTSAPASMTH